MAYNEKPQSFLILDIETVPDFSFWSPEEEPEEEKKGAKKSKLPPPHAHQPVAVGCVWIGSDMSTRRIGCISSAKVVEGEPKPKFPSDPQELKVHTDAQERKILTDWNEFMERERPAIVTWNGRGFDMPVLTLRSFRWGIRQKWYDKDYRYRYNDEWHMDLLDVMTDYGSVSKAGFKLDAVAKILGLPGKYGVDGSQVAGMYAEGRLDEIETYCQTDVIQTGFVLLRFLLTRGKIGIDAYREGVKKLLEATHAQPRFKEFASLINEKQLLLGD